MIWRNYVPEAGQSEILQGELLREIEKLREEAQGNGNRNWDGDFSCFVTLSGKRSAASRYTVPRRRCR